MVDWAALLSSYWWIVALIIATVFVVVRVHNFFQFFMGAFTLVAIFYIAAIIFFPVVGGKLPAEEISNVLGVSTSSVSEASESADSTSETANEEGSDSCSGKIDSKEALTDCIGQWMQNIQMPDFKGVLGEYVVINPVTEPEASK